MKKQRFKFPSVTEILEPYVDLSMILPDILIRAQARGTAVHHLIKGYVTFGLVTNLPDQYQGYMESFIQWYHDVVDKVILAEHRIYNEGIQLCGQPDLVVKFKGETLARVIDAKTPKGKYATWKSQVAGYKFLYDQNTGEPTDMPGHLRLRENGKYPIMELLEPAVYAKELEMLFKALTCYHHYA